VPDKRRVAVGRARPARAAYAAYQDEVIPSYPGLPTQTQCGRRPAKLTAA